MTEPDQPPASPAPAFAVPWRIRDPIFVLLRTYLAFAGLMIVLGLLIGLDVLPVGELLREPEVGKGHFTDLLDRSPWFEVLYLIQLLLTVLFFHTLILQRWSFDLRRFFPSGQAASEARYAVGLFFKCFLFSLGAIVAIVGLMMGISLLLQRPPAAFTEGYLSGIEREANVLMSSQASWLRLVLFIGVAPLIEEVLFRGCLYGAMRKRLAPWKANLASNAIFALSHHYVFGLPNILIVGILGAHAYERTRSLRAPIIFHMLWNAFCSTTVKPVMWAVLLLALLGLLVWTKQATRRSSVAPAAPRQTFRWGWKLYAWVFVLLSLAGYLSNPEEAWEAWVELPAYVACFAYAYRKRIALGGVWLIYGVTYAAWIIQQFAGEVNPVQWQQRLDELMKQGVPVEAAQALQVGWFGAFLCLAIVPVIIIWRLATKRE